MEFISSSFHSSMATKESEILMQSLFCSDQKIDTNYGSQYINTNMLYWPMENSCNFTSFSCSNKQISNFEIIGNNMGSNMMPMRSEPFLLHMEEENLNAESTQIDQKNHFDVGGNKKSRGKRKIEVCEGGFDLLKIESSSKKAGKSIVRRLKDEKDDKNVEVEEEEELGSFSAAIVKNSSCYSYEDEANNSEELNGRDRTITSTKPKELMESLNSIRKIRAGRGTTMDPQSLYARRRRERINERLKILQNLIPNGTKVDISTMLEEAVQYVKFLKVQIKLLSSDELWMYAPIAYNALNVGFDLKMSPS